MTHDSPGGAVHVPDEVKTCEPLTKSSAWGVIATVAEPDRLIALLLLLDLRTVRVSVVPLAV